MKSWIVNKLGDPKDVLELKELMVPSVKEGELLIQVEASS